MSADLQRLLSTMKKDILHLRDSILVKYVKDVDEELKNEGVKPTSNIIKSTAIVGIKRGDKQIKKKEDRINTNKTFKKVHENIDINDIIDGAV